jgi:penicillin-binding protein 1C
VTTEVEIVRATPRRRTRRVVAGIALLLLFLTVLAGLALVETMRDLENRYAAPKDIQVFQTSRVVLDRSDRLLRPFTIANGRWRLPVTKADVDPHFLDMLVAYEDKRFYSHEGVDFRALARAAGQMLTSGHIVSGASTLTMQVARLASDTETRTAMGKLRQIAIARALEKKFTKDEILTIYLTLAPYGGNLEGIRAASLAYFGKEPKRLTPAEAALLVALPQSPEARRPDRDVVAARAARDRVLDRMQLAGVIDEDTAQAAKHERVPEARREFPMLAAHLGQAAVRAQPDREVIKLTVDRELQASLEALARERIAALGPKLSAAIVVADHRTGNILASVGSAGLFNDESDGFVDMTKAVRSPGSTLKPLIYGLAFELGMAHPESLIEDRPTAFNGYIPVNFDGFNRGTVTIRLALVDSLNIPAVVVLDAIGTARLVSRLKRANVAIQLPQETAPSLAIGLGGVGVTLRDLVSVYTAIARGGSPILLRDGVTPPPAGTPVIPAPVLDSVAAYYVADILADVAPPLNGSRGRVAFKTGTSYGYRDAWSVGFDGKTVIGVWVGRPDGVPVPGISGIRAAAPILFEAFDRLATPVAPFRSPPNGVLFGTNADLPDPLKRFRHPDEDVVARDAAPEIAFPSDGVDVDLGLKDGYDSPLIVKVRNGVPPFTFFANGAPFGRSAFARQNSWTPDGPGFVTLSVVDAEGRSDNVTVFLN